MMDNHFLLDLQSKKGIDEGIKFLLGKNYTRVKEFLSQYLFEESEEFDVAFDLRYLEHNIEIDWESIDISNLWIKSYHFTTRNNKADVFSSLIYNLPHMVTADTTLKTFFKKHHIEFDLENHLVHIEGKTYNIHEHDDDSHNPMYWIDAKLYTDPEVWAFARTLDISNYNNEFPDTPEFIKNVADILKDAESFLNDWADTFGQPFVIEFKEHLSKIKIYDGYDGEFSDDDGDSCLVMKKRLLNLLLSLYLRNLRKCGFEVFKEFLPEEDISKIAHALCRLNEHQTGDFDMILTSLLKGNNVAVENIINVWDYKEFQERSRLDNCLF
ncbi:hypothetical protein PVA17_24575 [Lysinibacillus sp. CNPSo 3705]|uniref:hypothetical protein n=1 Tax=Lysinibacillus sp. CNPSo 3705 TaxID=3028148 RepID=UPI0023643EA5|nr:hypothetical protein [Lysinibacillus sp. CNPSo 3705]MDD1505892.1 hypothetical protein [Lysinibacillus sp. CNPSo 3705]